MYAHSWVYSDYNHHQYNPGDDKDETMKIIIKTTKVRPKLLLTTVLYIYKKLLIYFFDTVYHDVNTV